VTAAAAGKPSEVGAPRPGYDYLRVDSGSRRLFVAHGTRVEVIDADGGTRLGAVTNLAGVHGIEIVDRLHMAFATNGTDRTVTSCTCSTPEPANASRRGR
jgi:hypothetical protein